MDSPVPQAVENPSTRENLARRRIRRWRESPARGRRLLQTAQWPTTAIGVDLALMAFAIASRGGLLLIAAIPTIRSAAVSPSPPLFWGLTAACGLTSLGWMVNSARRKALPNRRWLIADSTVNALALATGSIWIHVDNLHGSWLGWPELVALNACCVASGAVRKLAHALTIGAGWALLWLVSVPPHLSDRQWADLSGTALNFMMFALLLFMISSFVQRLARAADDARQEAALAAAEAEHHRARVLVHDSVGMLSLLTEVETPDVVAQSVRAQAQETVRRMRNYLTEEGGARITANPHTLGEVIGTAIAGFEDLPLELLIDLGKDIPVSPERSAAVEQALRTLLQNVRIHAEANEVVIHACATDRGWELTLRDDGVGFDLSEASLGFGLRHQVMTGLSRVGVACEIASEPGGGTSVTLFPATRAALKSGLVRA